MYSRSFSLSLSFFGVDNPINDLKPKRLSQTVTRLLMVADPLVGTGLSLAQTLNFLCLYIYIRVLSLARFLS